MSSRKFYSIEASDLAVRPLLSRDPLKNALLNPQTAWVSGVGMRASTTCALSYSQLDLDHRDDSGE